MADAVRILGSRSHQLTIYLALMALMLQPHMSLAGDGGNEVDNSDEDISHNLRYVFPFYPKELDILIRHLETEIYRLDESLKTCEEINDGNHEAGNRVIDMYDGGDNIDIPSERDDKLELIAKFRETIKEKEADLEKCRFNFWTGGDIE